MKVRFWGVRGSYPVPGAATNRYGGNTSCVQICPGDGTVLIIDAGTGIRKLGQRLMRGPLGSGEGECHLLVSHTHWDHIQGLPFFAPLYEAGNRINLYGRQREIHLKTIFSSQTDEPYFPVSLDEVAADVCCVELIAGAFFNLGDTTVRCALLNHPGLAIGYRMESGGRSVAYISDTSPFDQILFREGRLSGPPTGPPTPEEAAELQRIRRGVIGLCKGCDLVIYDTMFTMEEYTERPHWGHSSSHHAVELVEEARARALALYHHAPDRSDDHLDRMVSQIQTTTSLQLLAAAEGQELVLTDDGVEQVRLADFSGTCSGETT